MLILVGLLPFLIYRSLEATARAQKEADPAPPAGAKTQLTLARSSRSNGAGVKTGRRVHGPLSKARIAVSGPSTAAAVLELAAGPAGAALVTPLVEWRS